jgi:transposase-like protein
VDSKQINKIRRTVSQAKESAGTGRVRYPKHMKEQVAELLRAGQSPTEISALIGIGAGTLFKWSRRADEVKGSFRRVEAAESEVVADTVYKIIFPSGVRIECAQLSALCAVLEHLK